MTKTTLMSDIFPRGVVIRMAAKGSKFVLKWQYKERPYSIEADSIEEGTREAMQAIQALEQEDGPV